MAVLRQGLDDVRSTVGFVGFERFDITGGAGDDLLAGRDLNDRLVGGPGNDRIESGLGADTIQGGGGTDRWVAHDTTRASPIFVTLLSVGTATVVGIGVTLNSIEAISLDTGAGAGDDFIALGRGGAGQMGATMSIRCGWIGRGSPMEMLG